MDINRNDSRNSSPYYEMKSYVARAATLPAGSRYDAMAKNGLFGWKDRILCYKCGHGDRVPRFQHEKCQNCKN